MADKFIYLLMILGAIFWSGAFITGKIAVQEFPPFALTFLRFFFALPLIFWLLYLREPGNLAPRGGQWRPLILLGLIGTFGYHALFFIALNHTTAINSSLIGAMNPMITTLLAALFFQEGLSVQQVLGICLSFSGVAVVVSNADLQLLAAFQFNAGDLFMLAAVCCWAVYSLLSRRYMQQYRLSPLMVTAYTFSTCAVVSLPLAIWENPAAYLPQATAGGWLSILYMSVFASVLGYCIQLMAIQRIGASRTASFINLVPAFTIAQSVIFLGESVTALKLAGAATIIGGVYLAIGRDKACLQAKTAKGGLKDCNAVSGGGFGRGRTEAAAEKPEH